MRQAQGLIVVELIPSDSQLPRQILVAIQDFSQSHA
jgi:hypothetical protein